MNYVSYINQLLQKKVLSAENIVLFGQNIAAGSCLSGLTRDLRVRDGGLIINTPNSENSMVGVGLGLMLGGVSSIFFMKQLDFLLLGVDHLVNTYNFIRIHRPKASFTIMPIIVDIGFQGMQSSYNSLGGFCSLAKVPGYTITNRHDAERIINSHLIKPGFRIIGVSQRLFNQPIPECEPVVYADEHDRLFQYYRGRDVTIVCFNFSFPHGLELCRRLRARGMMPSLFNVNYAAPMNWNRIIGDVRATGRIVVIDDSKYDNHSGDDLLVNVLSACRVNKKEIIRRGFSNEWFFPNPEELAMDYERVIKNIIGEA